jgi:hypothetical protein
MRSIVRTLRRSSITLSSAVQISIFVNEKRHNAQLWCLIVISSHDEKDDLDDLTRRFGRFNMCKYFFSSDNVALVIYQCRRLDYYCNDCCFATGTSLVVPGTRYKYLYK